MDALKEMVDKAYPEMVATRRDFHRYPELGYQEIRTAGKVEESLAGLGLKPWRVTETGVVADLEGAKPGPVILLRADLDALPLEEDSGLEFASQNPGVMHACGHDAHAAVLLAAAGLLSAMRDSLCGTVRFLFEPNEEEVGALAMIEAGVLETPKVEAAAGLHLWAPLELGKISVEPGPSWAGMDHFRITVKGRGGHTASPHLAADPILAAAHIIAGLQVMQSRELDPFLASTLVFGKIAGGKAANVIPDQVELEGTLRYLFDGRDDGPYRPRIRMRELAGDIARAYRTEAVTDFYCSQPPLINHPGLAALGQEAAIKCLGDAKGLVKFLNLGGEDFSEFSLRVPGVFAMIGAGSPESGAVHPHHSPKFRLDERAMAIGLEWLVRLALSYLEEKSDQP